MIAGGSTSRHLPAIGQLLEVAEQLVGDQLVELFAGVELHGGRRIAADDAVDAGRARVLAAGDRGVDPGAAGRVNWSANTFTAADSPPEVHQCRTSAFISWAAARVAVYRAGPPPT